MFYIGYVRVLAFGAVYDSLIHPSLEVEKAVENLVP
jgi:hypothetical protein